MKLNYIFNKVAIPVSLSSKVKKKTIHSNFLYIAKQLLQKTDQSEKISHTSSLLILTNSLLILGNLHENIIQILTM